jgi:hypothetical protein
LSQHFDFNLVKAEDPGLAKDVASYLAEEDLNLTVTKYTLVEQDGKKTLQAGGYTMEDLTVGVSPELRAALLNVTSRLSQSNPAIVLSRPQDNFPGKTDGDSVLYVFWKKREEVLLFSFKIPAEKLQKFLVDAKVKLDGLEGKGHFNQILQSFAKNVNAAISGFQRPEALRRFLEDYQHALEFAVSQKLERAKSKNLAIKEIVLHSYKEVLDVAKENVFQSSEYGARTSQVINIDYIDVIKEEIYFGLQPSPNLSEVLEATLPQRQQSDSVASTELATWRQSRTESFESSRSPISLIRWGEGAGFALFPKSTVPSGFESQQRARALPVSGSETIEANFNTGFPDYNHSRLINSDYNHQPPTNSHYKHQRPTYNDPQSSDSGLSNRYFSRFESHLNPPEDKGQKLFSLLAPQSPKTQASFTSNSNSFFSGNSSIAETGLRARRQLQVITVIETFQKERNFASSLKLNDTKVVTKTQQFDNTPYLASFARGIDDFSVNSRFLQEYKKPDYESAEIPQHLESETLRVSELLRNSLIKLQASSFSPRTSNVLPILQMGKPAESVAKRANKLLNYGKKKTLTRAVIKQSFLSKIPYLKVLTERIKVGLCLFLSRREASYPVRRPGYSLNLKYSRIGRIVSRGFAKGKLDVRFSRLLLTISVALAQARLRFVGKKSFQKVVWLGGILSLRKKIFWKPRLAALAFRDSKFILKLPRRFFSELLRKKILVERKSPRFYPKNEALILDLNRIVRKVNQSILQKFGKRSVFKVFSALKTERLFKRKLKFFRFFTLIYKLILKKLGGLKLKKQVDFLKLKRRVRFKSQPVKFSFAKNRFGRSKKAQQDKLEHKSSNESFLRVILFLLFEPVARKAFVKFFVFFVKKIRKFLGQVDENFIFYLLLKLQIKKQVKGLKKEILIKPTSKILKPAGGLRVSQGLKVRQGRIFSNLTLQIAKV